MSNKVTLNTAFVVPDDMDEENVRHILSQFFGDLMRTDRVIDARIVEEMDIEMSEQERAIELLQELDDESLKKMKMFVEEYTDSEIC